MRVQRMQVLSQKIRRAGWNKIGVGARRTGAAERHFPQENGTLQSLCAIFAISLFTPILP
jgi:hypothetical protein